ncbi:MAG: MBL fold metallo-hydrolase [Bacteroidota bacterium]
MVHYEKGSLTVFQSALFKTNTTVVQTDDLVLVADPNWLPHEIEEVRQYVNSIRQNKPLFLLFTHSDYDHILGYNAFPEATVIASKAFADNPKKQEVIEQILQFDDDYYVDRPYKIEYPQIDIPVTEKNKILGIGNTRLHFELAPGHNADGIFAIVEPGGIFIAGDYLSDVEFPFIYHSVSQYNQTLQKATFIFENRKISHLVPGHGSVCNSPGGFAKRLNDSKVYLERLLQSVITGISFDLESLFRKYHYPRLMKKFHDDNLALLKTEIAANKA